MAKVGNPGRPRKLRLKKSSMKRGRARRNPTRMAAAVGRKRTRRTRRR